MQFYTREQVRYTPPVALPPPRPAPPPRALPFEDDEPEMPSPVDRPPPPLLFVLVTEDGRDLPGRHPDVVSANVAARQLNRRVVVVKEDPQTRARTPMSFAGPGGWSGSTRRAVHARLSSEAT